MRQYAMRIRHVTGNGVAKDETKAKKYFKCGGRTRAAKSERKSKGTAED
jgi:hypothetical protein